MTNRTLIVLNTENLGELRLNGGALGHRIADAVQQWSVRDQDPTVLDFGFGRVVWQGSEEELSEIVGRLDVKGGGDV